MLLLYVVVIRIHSIIDPKIYVALESDTLITKNIFSIIGSPLAQNILAIALVYFHVLFINRLVIKHRLANQITLLPGLIYTMMVSMLPEYNLLTPYLIANTFILVTISQLFKTYKRPKSADILFNVGFFIALASLFVSNYILLLLVGLIGLIVLRSMKINEILQLLSGAFLVLLIFSGTLFLLDLEFLPELLKIRLIPSLDVLAIRGSELYKILIVLVIAIFSVLNYGSYTLKKSIQNQKKIDILYWFMFASGIMFFLFDTKSAGQVLIVFIPLSILMNSTFIDIKNTMFQEAIHICLLALLFALNFGLI